MAPLECLLRDPAGLVKNSNSFADYLCFVGEFLLYLPGKVKWEFVGFLKGKMTLPFFFNYNREKLYPQ